MNEAVRLHWREYLMEAACLGLFMISACAVGVLLEYPRSWIHQALPDPVTRRILMGVAMGATCIGLFHSAWGKRSGAHMNPAVTLAFWSLGKIRGWDATFYIAAQFAGGLAGVAAASFAIGLPLAHAAVNYVVTMPGPWGEWTALWTEFLISLLMMTTVLVFSNHTALARYTPWAAAVLVTLYISVEAPFSGMSMNPARTFGSAAWAGQYHSLWIYCAAPPLAMLAAGRIYRAIAGAHRVVCAKFHHHNHQPCIFNCKWGSMRNA